MRCPERSSTGTPHGPPPAKLQPCSRSRSVRPTAPTQAPSHFESSRPACSGRTYFSLASRAAGSSAHRPCSPLTKGTALPTRLTVPGRQSSIGVPKIPTRTAPRTRASEAATAKTLARCGPRSSPASQGTGPVEARSALGGAAVASRLRMLSASSAGAWGHAERMAVPTRSRSARSKPTRRVWAGSPSMTASRRANSSAESSPSQYWRIVLAVGGSLMGRSCPGMGIL